MYQTVDAGVFYGITAMVYLRAIAYVLYTSTYDLLTDAREQTRRSDGRIQSEQREGRSCLNSFSSSEMHCTSVYYHDETQALYMGDEIWIPLLPTPWPLGGLTSGL